ncbi:GntR family transcriptional regulator [Kiloniella spongiae]|uniref:GntR family transcriptional regulator n=1 Tax=Kiloniella spongiae TaxID=1489064 RepID=A0A0H2MJ83_9PROT|nr:PLP-dependent aminotransferase family protein [Kiloniella spongiae]KLN62443.1 GntR family transcriptional regulator [Kiloniella spongiae]
MAIWIPNLDGRRGPKYLQIVEAMAEDISSGKLPFGTKLLPHRELAYQLGLSANTTSRAYAEAVKRALLRGEIGRGTFVRSLHSTLQEDKPSNLHRRNTGPIDLSQNLPFAGFAEPYVRRALEEISSTKNLSPLMDYQTEEDLRHHCDAGKIWLESCDLETKQDQIITTMGGQHGLLCILMGLLQAGDLLLTEALTYMPFRVMAERLGVHIKTVAMDDEGLIPEAFEELCKHSKPKALYLTPTLQAPTTLTLSKARREAIARIAENNTVLIIEDDVFGLLNPDSPAPIAKSAPQNTIYVTSLSKSVAPGLRVGFLHAPPHLVPALRNAVNLSVWMTPPITLEIATKLIHDGSVTHLTTQQRETAKHRQSLAKFIFGQTKFAANPNGFHIWMPLPDGWRADIFRDQCLRHGVLINEGRSFTYEASNAPEAIRICLSHEPEEPRLTEGLKKIADLLHLKPNEWKLNL